MSVLDETCNASKENYADNIIETDACPTPTAGTVAEPIAEPSDETVAPVFPEMEGKKRRKSCRRAWRKSCKRCGRKTRRYSSRRR